MRRLGISGAAGLFVTVALLLVGSYGGSRGVARAVFWNCSLLGFGPRSCPPGELCEGTPVDLLFALICLALTWLLYSVLVYLGLRLVGRLRRGGPLK